MTNYKVALVVDGLDVGGIEVVAINYIQIFQKLGYKVTLINLSKYKNKLYFRIPDGVEIFNFNLKRSSVLETYDIKFHSSMFWRALRLILKPLLEINFQLKTRKVKKMHFELGIAFSGHLNDLKFISENRILADKKIAWLHGSLPDYIKMSKHYESHYIKIKNLIELSSYGDKECRKIYNIKTLYNPVDLFEKKLNKEKQNILKEKYGDYILTVARFSKQKDHITIVKMAELLQRTHGIYNKLVFIGDGDTIDKVKGFVKEKKLQEFIFFEGEQIDVQNYYSTAKLLVHSSPEEGLPTVLIEAMFFGLPIVATNSLPGVPELLGNNEYGLISPVGNAEALAQNVKRILTQNDLCKNMSEKSVERSTKFSFLTITKDLDRFLESID